MPALPYEMPPARPHGDIVELFPDVFMVTGTMRLPAPFGVHCSRNMTIVREGESLVLINSVRLDESGLAALDALGRVEHVVRLAGFHGSDDPFYAWRHGATVWAMPNQPYARGLSVRPPESATYYRPDHVIRGAAELPVAARLYPFESSAVGEALLLLERDGGILVSGDALQNWAPDRYFDCLGRISCGLLGFFRPYNVGPGWLRQARPAATELRGILDLPFEHVLPAHGTPVIGGARQRYRSSILEAAKWAERAR